MACEKSPVICAERCEQKISDRVPVLAGLVVKAMLQERLEW